MTHEFCFDCTLKGSCLYQYRFFLLLLIFAFLCHFYFLAFLVLLLIWHERPLSCVGRDKNDLKTANDVVCVRKIYKFVLLSEAGRKGPHAPEFRNGKNRNSGDEFHSEVVGYLKSVYIRIWKLPCCIFFLMIPFAIPT